MIPPPVVTGVPGVPSPLPPSRYGIETFGAAAGTFTWSVPGGVAEVGVLISGALAVFLIPSLRVRGGTDYTVRIGGAPERHDLPPALASSGGPFPVTPSAGGSNGGSPGFSVPIIVANDDDPSDPFVGYVVTASWGATELAKGSDLLAAAGGFAGYGWQGPTRDEWESVHGPTSGDGFPGTPTPATTSTAVVESLAAPTADPRRPYPFSAADGVLEPGVVGGVKQGGPGRDRTYSRTFFGSDDYRVISGSGSGGHSGGASGAIMRGGPTLFPSQYATARPGRAGANYGKPGLGMVHAPGAGTSGGAVTLYWLLGGRQGWHVGIGSLGPW